MKRKIAFTLVELLAVIAIIGVLAGLLLPALWRAVTLGHDTRAREDIHQLTTAWKGYLNRYRQFPTEADGSLVMIEEMDTNAISILLGNAHNPENLHFMEFKASHLQNGFLDPWGDKALEKGDSSWQNRRYQVALDIGQGAYDGTPAYDGKITPPQFPQPMYQTVIAWSRGKDGANGGKDDIIGK